ncbi:hypothetical protein V6N13_125178 [Hibiscus sabdariffa]|uniref:Uncharacterized protein n=1 Tax=Hibiscus sabdariffa TaxID=183260 RepID=A0ABR2U5P1_9ROSI
MKVELSVANGEDKFREVDSHLEDLDGKVVELCEEMLGALNEATEENKALRDELKVVNGELISMMDEIVLLKKALAHERGAT